MCVCYLQTQSDSSAPALLAFVVIFSAVVAFDGRRRHEKKKRAEWLAVVVGKAAAAAAAEAAFHPAVRAIETRRVSEEEKSHFVLAPCHGMCLKVVDEKCSFEECD